MASSSPLSSAHNLLNGVDAIIFDMDGTIVLSRELAVAAVIQGIDEMSRRLGSSIPNIDEQTVICNIGKTSPEYFAAILPGLEPAVRAEVEARIKEIEVRMLADGNGVFAPGAPSALARLKEKGLKLGLASNCDLGYFQANIEALSLDDYFDVTLCSGERGFPHKSELVSEVAEKLLAERPIVVGDTTNDLAAAQVCEIPFIGVLYGYGTRAELADSAIHLIKSLDELVDVVE
ncbi:HAD family hydrolase [bacterium]|nr:HAD family hydrolase [bacterium]